MEYNNVKIVGVITFIVWGVAYFGRGYVYEKLNNKAATLIQIKADINTVRNFFRMSLGSFCINRMPENKFKRLIIRAI